MSSVTGLQDGQAAVQNGGQLPQHQQHLHGHAMPQGAAAATGPNRTTAGANGSSQSSGTGQQPADGGSGNASGGASSSEQQGGGANGQGGDGNDPGRGNQGESGHAASSSGQTAQQQQQQQGDPNQQQGASAPMSGAWAAANYGYVWNMPQWVPATSMALFAPAMGYHPMQYAGQTNPASVAPELQVQHQYLHQHAMTVCTSCVVVAAC